MGTVLYIKAKAPGTLVKEYPGATAPTVLKAAGGKLLGFCTTSDMYCQFAGAVNYMLINIGTAQKPQAGWVPIKDVEATKEKGLGNTDLFSVEDLIGKTVKITQPTEVYSHPDSEYGKGVLITTLQPGILVTIDTYVTDVKGKTWLAYMQKDGSGMDAYFSYDDINNSVNNHLLVKQGLKTDEQKAAEEKAKKDEENQPWYSRFLNNGAKDLEIAGGVLLGSYIFFKMVIPALKRTPTTTA